MVLTAFMVFFATRKVKGKLYYYIERNIRLPDTKIVKISKLVKSIKKSDLLYYEHQFQEKEKELLVNYALQNYTFNYPLSKEDIAKIEGMKVEYKRILQQLKKKGLRKDLWDRFTVNFTYETNALEGNSLTLKDVAIVLFEQSTIPGKELREIYETRNSRPVVDLLVQRKIRITSSDIVKVHALLMKDIASEKGYKKLPNFILGSTLETSPPEKVPEDMDTLIAWYQTNETKIHPLQLATHFHARFLRIHPFQDGNGRLARILLNAQLVNKGYPPLIIRKTQRTAYLKSLRAADHNNYIPLMRFLLEKFKKTYSGFFEVYEKYV